MNKQTVNESRQLLRLRALREDTARAELDRRRAKEAECQAVVDRRLAQIARVRGDRLALLRWQSGEGAADAPRVHSFAAARLAALDDELERAEVDLIDERNALDQARRDTAAAQADWLRARARHQAVDELATAARRAWARAVDQRAEREIEARPPVEAAA